MTDTTPMSEGQRLAAAQDATIAALKIQVQKAAEAERDYRLAKSEKYVEAAGMDVLAAAKTAWVDAQTSEARYKRDLADGMKSVLFQEVQNYRRQMSFAQSLMKADGEERDSYKYGQSGQT